VIAFVRPDAWDFPLFLHVLGATALFGGVATMLLLSIEARRIPLHAAFARRLALITLLAVVWPSYVVMRGGAEWISAKEDLHPDFPTWVAIGVGVGDGGIVALLLLTLLGWLAVRRARAGSFFAGLSVLYLVALGVAWWAMTAKPGA
jgi:uncharacterized membrane protein YhaH (DUF805 family)